MYRLFGRAPKAASSPAPWPPLCTGPRSCLTAPHDRQPGRKTAAGQGMALIRATGLLLSVANTSPLPENPPPRAPRRLPRQKKPKSKKQDHDAGACFPAAGGMQDGRERYVTQVLCGRKAISPPGACSTCGSHRCKGLFFRYGSGFVRSVSLKSTYGFASAKSAGGCERLPPAVFPPPQPNRRLASRKCPAPTSLVPICSSSGRPT